MLKIYLVEGKYFHLQQQLFYSVKKGTNFANMLANITCKDLGATCLYSLACLFLTWSSRWEIGQDSDEETQYRHVVSV